MPRRMPVRPKAEPCMGRKKLSRASAFRLRNEAKKQGSILWVYVCQNECRLRSGARAWHVRHVKKRH